MGWRGDNRGLLVTRTHLAVLRHAAIKLNGGNALAARQSTSVGARRGRATVNHILPTSTASKHTTFGPDAFTPEFVKAVRAAASDAPPAARVNEQGWQSSTCDVEEAQWSQSVHGRRVR